MSELAVIPVADLKSIISDTVRTEVSKLMPWPEVRTPQVADETAEIISRKEAAQLLSVSTRTLLDWTKQGIVPAYRISSRVRYRKSEVIDSMNKMKTATGN